MAKDNGFMIGAHRPLDEQYLLGIAKDLEWSDFHWGENSLIVKGTSYEKLKNYKFFPVN